ncbi:MAG: hypothetical protein H8K06_05455 [Nitrospira sp.]|nr:hypothetical protein [Nitrospira sp.]
MKNPSVNSIIVERRKRFNRWFVENHADPDHKFSHMPSWLKADLRKAWDAATAEAATIISGLQATVARIKTQRDNALLDMEKFMNVVTDCCGILGLADDNYTELPASLSRIKAETIEECAKVAEKDRRSELAVKYDYMPDFQKCAIYIAEEIRSLGSTGEMDSEKTAQSKHSPSTQNTRTE